MYLIYTIDISGVWMGWGVWWEGQRCVEGVEECDGRGEVCGGRGEVCGKRGGGVWWEGYDVW